MSVKTWLAASVILAGLSLAAPTVPAQQQQGQQQSGDAVADAARRAREQKKAAPKPKKVYTDDDIKPAAPSSATGAGGAQATPDNGQAAVAAGTGTGKDDAENAWRKRFADQRGKIAAAEKELDILQREAAKAQLQYYNDPQKALTEQNTRKEINEKNAQIEQKKQDIANLKQQLSDLEDELRKSGGDAGWAR